MNTLIRTTLIGCAVMVMGCGGGGSGPTGPVQGPTVSVSDAVSAEPGVAVFLVTLSKSLDKPVTFDWATRQGTAISNADYAQASGTDTIPAGSTFTVDSVIILDDLRIEGPETFDFVLSKITNATFADSIGTASINASDGAGIASGHGLGHEVARQAFPGARMQSL